MPSPVDPPELAVPVEDAPPPLEDTVVVPLEETVTPLLLAATVEEDCGAAEDDVTAADELCTTVPDDDTVAVDDPVPCEVAAALLPPEVLTAPDEPPAALEDVPAALEDPPAALVEPAAWLLEVTFPEDPPEVPPVDDEEDEESSSSEVPVQPAPSASAETNAMPSQRFMRIAFSLSQRRPARGRAMPTPIEGRPAQIKAARHTVHGQPLPARGRVLASMSAPRGPSSELFKSTLLGVMLTIMRTSTMAARVDVSQVIAFISDQWERLFRDGTLDLGPVGEHLAANPKVKSGEVAAVLLFLKKREQKLGVNVRLPAMVDTLPDDVKDRLLQEVMATGVQSGVTLVGMARVKNPAPVDASGPAHPAQGLTERVRGILNNPGPKKG
ncbi:MAG: hypothetical protein HY904_08900 [Deltaproteobacteria bacterium]|nr:hypothetical protein [Deltaproteobacteria bacterium]